MSLTCIKPITLTIITQFPRCNCPGDLLGIKRSRIVGYADNMLNPAMAPGACTPDVMVPNVIWDGTFPVPTVGWCVWQSDPATDTININRRFGGAELRDTGGGTWALTVSGLQGMIPTVLWSGESPPGTGGPCTSPIGLTFTGVAPFPIFCGFPGPSVPATLTIEEA